MRSLFEDEMHSHKELGIKIFADGADLDSILALYKNPLIAGFTTNPTLMRVAGISDYKGFALSVLREVRDRPVSFEVFSDDEDQMELQALEIASWGENVYVKIPITNTQGMMTTKLIKNLSDKGVKVNVTAVMTLQQVASVIPAIKNSSGSYVSIFAGRIADSGVDPLEIMAKSVEFLKTYPNIELIWASPREVLNVVQAAQINCDIITLTNSILSKLPLLGKDLETFSLETVKMFHRDANLAGYCLDVSESRLKNGSAAT